MAELFSRMIFGGKVKFNDRIIRYESKDINNIDIVRNFVNTHAELFDTDFGFIIQFKRKVKAR